MTVAELIAKLQAMPQDAIVLRQLDEFFGLTLVGAPKSIVVRAAVEGEWGEYAEAASKSVRMVGEAFLAVELCE